MNRHPFLQNTFSPVKLIAFALAITLLSGGAAAFADAPIVGIAKLPTKTTTDALDKTLYDFQVFELDVDAISRRVDAGRLDLHLGNRTFGLQLEPNDLRDPQYRAVLMDGDREIEVDVPLVTFAGHVAGDETSIVRVTVDSGAFYGYIKTENEWLFIDPLSDFVPAAKGTLRTPGADVVVYRDRDVRPDASGVCGSSHLHKVADDFGIGNDAPVGLGAEGFGAGGFGAGLPQTKMGRRVDVATDFDGQYFQQYGNPGSFNRITGVINGIDGIYQSQLNLDLNIVYQMGWGNPGTDPYTSLNAQTTLFQFRDWWNANRTNINRDLAHQFSGKNFSGSTVGIAWVGVICNNGALSYGVSQDQGSSFLRNQLAAHEIGHNFSANHDNQIGCPVSCNGSGPIMCSFLQSSGSNSFSSCSRNAIANHTANNGFCLN